MGHLPTIPDVYRCTLNLFNSDGQHVHNVLHIQSPGSNPTEVGLALNNHFTDDMWSDLSSSFAVNTIDVLPLDGAAGTTVVPVTSAHNQGQAGGDYLPAYAVKVELRTGLRGRARRGRVLVGPISESSVVSGVVVGTGVDDMAAAWSTFKDVLAGLGTPKFLGVASYHNRDFFSASSIFTTRQPAVLRRRQKALVL